MNIDKSLMSQVLVSVTMFVASVTNFDTLNSILTFTYATVCSISLLAMLLIIFIIKLISRKPWNSRTEKENEYIAKAKAIIKDVSNVSRVYDAVGDLAIILVVSALWNTGSIVTLVIYILLLMSVYWLRDIVRSLE